MPLKLNVGLMKKIGQPHYGSLSASCHLEIELECSLWERDAEGLQARMRNIFAACRQAVETELAIGDVRKPSRLSAEIEATVEGDSGAAATSWSAEAAAAQNGAHAPVDRGGPPNGATAGGDDSGLAPASKSQISYVRRLASSIGRATALRVEVLAQRSYGKPLMELSRAEAGRLIATLRAVKSGELDWETLREEAAA